MAEDARGRYADEDEPPAQPDAEGPPEEYRVLFAAAEYGRADIVASAAGMLKEKLAPGEDLAEALGAARNDADESLLEKACACQKVDAVRALLRVGAMPKAAEPVAWLEEGSACRAAAHAELMQQVALGDAGRVTKLLALLGPVPRLSDAATFGGDSPLHWAASFGQEGPLAALLAAGCDVNAVNDDGVTPLHEAARAGHAPCVALLLGGGADAALRISDGPDAGKAPADLAKAEANLVPADQLLRLPPHGAKYAADSYDAEGKPTKLADGGALSKGQEKEVLKLHKKQAEAFTKQAAQLEATPDLIDAMRAALAALRAELRAVLADAPTMAVLSSEMVAQMEAVLA